MVEVEIKFPAPQDEHFEQKLHARRPDFIEERRERDQYFNAPDRDFGVTDEALRIRQVGSATKLTYKGPKRDLQTKTRTELEVALAGPEATAETMAQILQCLGYRPSGVVEKQRHVYQLALAEFEAEICFDTVLSLGRFVELEIVVDEGQVANARDALLGLATELGLGQPERRSYLELMLNRGATTK
jgi:adenylate cyclase class 2